MQTSGIPLRLWFARMAALGSSESERDKRLTSNNASEPPMFPIGGDRLRNAAMCPSAIENRVFRLCMREAPWRVQWDDASLILKGLDEIARIPPIPLPKFASFFDKLLKTLVLSENLRSKNATSLHGSGG